MAVPIMHSWLFSFFFYRVNISIVVDKNCPTFIDRVAMEVFHFKSNHSNITFLPNPIPLKSLLTPLYLLNNWQGSKPPSSVSITYKTNIYLLLHLKTSNSTIEKQQLPATLIYKVFKVYLYMYCNDLKKIKLNSSVTKSINISTRVSWDNAPCIWLCFLNLSETLVTVNINYHHHMRKEAYQRDGSQDMRSVWDVVPSS